MAGPDETPEFGDPLGGWTPPRRPDFDRIEGATVSLERLDPDRHAASLFAACSADDRVWDYLPYGPFPAADDYRAWARRMAEAQDPFFLAIVPKHRGVATGVASYLRITPEAGSIEVGHICLSPALQGTVAATEAMFLMADWAFSAGYRRYEWKCDALNRPSRRAAMRLGFSFEGVFRQAAVVKGRNRDTAWFAIIDRDWPALRAAHVAWLDPGNFRPDGLQLRRLSDLTRPLLYRPDAGADGPDGRRACR